MVFLRQRQDTARKVVVVYRDRTVASQVMQKYLAYRIFEASSANSERSPFSRLMWA